MAIATPPRPPLAESTPNAWPVAPAPTEDPRFDAYRVTPSTYSATVPQGRPIPVPDPAMAARPQPIPTAEEQKLMRWARDMGLPMPYEDESARQGWPKSSSWQEPPHMEEHIVALAPQVDQTYPAHGDGLRFDYAVGNGPQQGPEFGGSQSGSSEGEDFHYRKVSGPSHALSPPQHSTGLTPCYLGVESSYSATT